MIVEMKFNTDLLARISIVKRGNKELPTPTFFPAVSSLQTFGVKELLEIIIKENYSKILLSSYDFSHVDGLMDDKILAELSEYGRTGNFVILDSGLFESYRKGDDKWGFSEYSETVKKVDADFYMTYDVSPDKVVEEENLFLETESGIRKSTEIIRNGESIPIFHGHTPNSLISQVSKYIEGHPLNNSIIAIPERECGFSIVERATTIRQISSILRTHNETVLLHVLGCGNPLSMSLFTYCGADTFDSIDWTNSIFDRRDNKGYDISYIDLLNCSCEVCSSSGMASSERALLHNLLYFQDYVEKLRFMIKNNTLKDYIQSYFGRDIIMKLSAQP